MFQHLPLDGRYFLTVALNTCHLDNEKKKKNKFKKNISYLSQRK